MAQTSGTGKYEKLLERCKSLAPIPTAVAYPCDDSAISGAVEAAKLGLIVPLLVGPAASIKKAAKSAEIDLDKFEIVDASDSRDAAAKAVALVREGRAEILMKGSLHTDELMASTRRRHPSPKFPIATPLMAYPSPRRSCPRALAALKKIAWTISAAWSFPGRSTTRPTGGDGSIMPRR